MARTAPAVDGTPLYRTLSLSWIDASGDLRTDTIQLPVATTNAQMEALAEALADVSNASLYKITVGDVYNSTADKSDAVDAVKDSVYDNLVILAKTALNASARIFIPAPEGGLFVPGTDQIDPSDVDLGLVLTAMLAALGVDYDVVSIRYTERREINESVKI